ncbi:MAG: tRNA (adenosine(37)-N6)-threonylcarbamoyltransferase complex transferase subunit TsaD [bacterium]|nr:tRNA (adenosine(37)-N6)-threonylcarbamoyltransferase complex transferase subunit TsaD [bacterium]
MAPEHPLILGIETSCDDTACAVIDGAGRVLASVVSSQLAAHRPYGGVVPEIASREHLKNWPAVSAEALRVAGIELPDVDAVAATRGPGLVGSLLVGLSLGRGIARGLEVPFHGVHHIEGHLVSPFLDAELGAASVAPERFHGLVISGGHTSLLDVRDGQVSSMVETRDDAMGEVFDKVGKRLGLDYPQGPRVDELAEEGEPDPRPFSVARAKGELFFSFSGLKTQALRAIEQLERDGVLSGASAHGNGEDLPAATRDLLAGFRRTAVDQILDRLERSHSARPIDLLAVSGGVAANRLLRRELVSWADRSGVDLRLVPLIYSGDNAAMIAFAALERQRHGFVGDSEIAPASRLPFDKLPPEHAVLERNADRHQETP